MHAIHLLECQTILPRKWVWPSLLVFAMLAQRSACCQTSDLYWDCYTVLPGETIITIAEKFSLDFRVLCDYNRLSLGGNCTLLNSGQQLRVPVGPLSPYACVDTPSYFCYKLGVNESLGSIQSKFVVPLDYLRAINVGINRSPFEIGTLVKVPLYTCLPTPSTSCYTPPVSTDVNSLAVMLGYSASAILAVNRDRISPSTYYLIPAGRPVFIPTPCTDRPGTKGP